MRLADLGICLRDTVSSSCSFVFLAAQGKVPIQDLYQDGWNFSRGIPEKMRYWDERDEESIVEETTGSEDNHSEYCDE